MNRRITRLQTPFIAAIAAIAALIVLSCAAAPAGAARTADCADAAVLGVRVTGTLAKGTMGEGARVHPNRDYSFTRVPAFLRGAEFTSHMYKKPATVHYTAEKAGMVYLLLQSPATPASLKIAGRWEACGKMDTVIKGTTYPWGIWQARVGAGWLMTARPSGGRSSRACTGTVRARMSSA